MAYTPVLLLTVYPCQAQQSAEMLPVMPRQLAAGTRQLELWILLRHLSISVVSMAEDGHCRGCTGCWPYLIGQQQPGHPCPRSRPPRLIRRLAEVTRIWPVSESPRCQGSQLPGTSGWHRVPLCLEECQHRRPLRR